MGKRLDHSNGVQRRSKQIGREGPKDTEAEASTESGFTNEKKRESRQTTAKRKFKKQKGVRRQNPFKQTKNRNGQLKEKGEKVMQGFGGQQLEDLLRREKKYWEMIQKIHRQTTS